jgi:hypothetical protein
VLAVRIAMEFTAGGNTEMIMVLDVWPPTTTYTLKDVMPEA